MKICQIQEFGIDQLAFTDRDILPPSGTQVLVKIAAASLNFRDYLMVGGKYNPKLKRPVVPLSDGAGVVEEVGPDVTRFKKGDRVAGIFFQTWLEGPPTRQKTSSPLGGPNDGVLAEYRTFSEEGLVAIPDHLSFEEAATLPCAAVTAWHALFEHAPMAPGDVVLLQGTGGVSIVALQFAVSAGLRTIITSSSDEKLARAKALGAHEGINYKTTPDWDVEARKLTAGEGVGKVIEVGGSETMPRSLRAVRTYGAISVIGVLSGVEPAISPTALLMNSLQVQGIFVGSRLMFERMNRAIALHKMKPVIDKTFHWTDIKAALHYMESQQHCGKICLTFS
jgi:NADPH:quinone reductase-like Zn-dependent oxidoreductase